jgi:hypothetical protein
MAKDIIIIGFILIFTVACIGGFTFINSIPMFLVSLALFWGLIVFLVDKWEDLRLKEETSSQ